MPMWRCWTRRVRCRSVCPVNVKRLALWWSQPFLGHYAHAHSLVITYNYVPCPLYGANHLSYHDFLTAFHIYTLRQCLHILAYVFAIQGIDCRRFFIISIYYNSMDCCWRKFLDIGEASPFLWSLILIDATDRHIEDTSIIQRRCLTIVIIGKYILCLYGLRTFAINALNWFRIIITECIISWLSVFYALNGRKVTMWILFRYEKVII